MLTRLTEYATAAGIARVVAIALVVAMAYYFLTSDAIRPGNAFLVPDLLLTALLLGAALVPRRWAVPAMIAAFGWAAAVWTAALSTYAVRDAFADGLILLALITPAVFGAGLLIVAAGSQQAGIAALGE